MAQTVTVCLARGANSVSLINDINTNGSSSGYAALCVNQAAINVLVQRNVDHLSTILLYDNFVAYVYSLNDNFLCNRCFK